MAMSPHYPGDIIDGRYEIIRMIGRGAMADVYQARDPDSGREVALKILNHAQVRDSESLSRFHLEAQVQEMLEHHTD